MVTRGFASKQRGHHLNIDVDMVLRVQYHGSQGLRFGMLGCRLLSNYLVITVITVFWVSDFGYCLFSIE